MAARDASEGCMLHVGAGYRRVTREEAIAELGGGNTLRELYGGQWVILPNAVLCFAEIGWYPWDSSFDAPDLFAWATGRPAELQPDPDLWFLPREVVGNAVPSGGIHLFARLRGWLRYLALGELAPCEQAGQSGSVWGAMFDLAPSIADDLWPVLNGSPVVWQTGREVDAALAQVGPRSSFEERFAALQHLVEHWHGPIVADDGCSEDELTSVTMPTALRRWYVWAGRRDAILSAHNQFFAPEHLMLDRGKLVFQMENQGVDLWATLPDGDDPPVFVRENRPDRPWKMAAETLTDFLIDACIESARLTVGRMSERALW